MSTQQSQFNCIAFLYSICVILLIMFIDGVNSELLEYCAQDTFQPQCKSNEVVLMEHALYGRFKHGKCITNDIGYCSADVLSWMDEKCSGRNTCEVDNADLYSDLFKSTSCSDLLPYLKASYICKRAVTFTKIDCPNSYTYSVTSHPKTISSHTLKEAECGYPEKPLTLEAKPGQKINISLYDFNWNQDNRYYRKCPHSYGYVIDTKTTAVSDICGGGHERVKQIFMSEGNVVQIVFQEEMLINNEFLIEFNAIGCPDITPPKDAWITQEGNKVTVGCHGSHDRWVLICNNSVWQGRYGNCVLDSVDKVVDSRVSKPKMPTVISLTLITGVTCVICCVAVTSIIVCFCYRKYKLDKPKSEAEYYTTTSIKMGARPPIPLPNGTMVSYRSFRPVNRATMNRQTLGSQRTNIPNCNQSNMGTLTGQIITTQDIPESNLLNEVIYDDPVNLIDDSVQYVNTGSIVNSLQYTKLQKEN